MPNKVVSRTQVPILAENLYLEIAPHFDAAGVYDRHQVRVLYQPLDDQDPAAPINGKRDFSDISLSAGQRSALASFLANLVGQANTIEGT